MILIATIVGFVVLGQVFRVLGVEAPMTVEQQAAIVRARMASSDYRACGEY
jgi:hypothetical protein